MTGLSRVAGNHWLSLVVLALITPSMVGAAEPNPDTNNEPCQWQCLEWVRQCDIDPRGIRRCQRRCVKLTQVCE
jgi:hypothetical protein